MKIRKTVKKIAALSTGAVMLGATLFGAMAADLSEYPSPMFIKDGQFDGIIVVGDSAASSDVVGSIDIATSLQYESKTTQNVASEGGVTVSVEGDAYKIEESSDFLEYGENTSDVVREIGDGELNALAEGSIRNNKGTFEYNQYLKVPEDAKVLFASDPDDDMAVQAGYLVLPAGRMVYEYTMAFPESLESDVDDDGVTLKDLKDKKITLFGKEYTIIDAFVDAANVGGTPGDNNEITLELMAGAVQDTMEEYETKSYTLNGVDYEVEIVAISAGVAAGGEEVILKVNGEVTEKLSEGDTYKLADETEVGIKTLLENEGTETGGGDIVEFYLGASKMVISDSEFNETGVVAHPGDNEIEVSGEEIEDVQSSVAAVVSGGNVVKISDIIIYWASTENIYVPKGGVLSDKMYEAGQLMENMDIKFEDVDVGDSDEIVIRAKGDDEYILEFTNRDGNVLEVPYLDIDNGATNFGSENDMLWIQEVNNSILINGNIGRRDYFLVNDGKDTFLLQYKGFDYDAATAADSQLEIKNIGSGDTLEFNAKAGAVFNGTNDTTVPDVVIKIGTHSFNAWLNGNANDVPLTVDLDANGTLGGSPTYYTKDEYNITFPDFATLGATANEAKITIETPDDLDAGAPPELIMVEFDLTDSVNANPEIEVNTPVAAWGAVATLAMNNVDDESDNKVGITKWGVSILQTDFDSSPDKIEMTLPEDQAEALVYITAGVTTISSNSAEGGTVQSTTVVPIEVGAAKLASEVSNIKGQNAIVVGGPCANSASAELMGVAQSVPDCLAGFEEGKAMIKLYENGGNVALLVAGATALDTRRACRVLANSEDYSLSGMEVEVSGVSTTFTDTTVTGASAPAPAPEPEPVEPEGNETA